MLEPPAYLNTAPFVKLSISAQKTGQQFRREEADEVQ